MTDLPLARPGTLTLCSTDIAAPPMTTVVDGRRTGYEPDLAAALALDMGLDLAWIDVRRWSEFATTLAAGQCDAILCNQAITPERELVHAFTRPYGRFDEGVVVRADSPIHSAADLVGCKVGAITGTTNLALASTFTGAEIVEFGSGEDAFHEMAQATLDGSIDAMVDDEIVLPALTRDGTLRVAFVVATRNPYGIALRPGSDTLCRALNVSLQRLVVDGQLESIWRRHFPGRPFPL